MAPSDLARVCDASPPRVGGPAARGDADASDQVLIASIGRGDQRAFEAFASRHVARSLAVAQRIVGNPSDAEEIVQDALLRVWRHAPRWQAGHAQVTTWLYRILVNLALDRVRRNRGRFVALAEAGEQADPAPDSHMVAEGRQLERFVARAVAALPARQRAALTLCCFEAMDCADAAQIMDISVAAMESLLVRGRRTLRERLDQFAAGTLVRNKPAAPRRREPALALAFPVIGRLGALASA